MKITDELKAKLLAAQSAGEAAAMVKADSQEITPEETIHLWEEIKKGREQDGRRLSVEELEAVSGGADRDWAVDDCAATVEQGSWCGSNDKCIHFEVTYEHLPCGDCPYCDGIVYEYSSFEGVYKCKKCGRISGRNAWMVDLP